MIKKIGFAQNLVEAVLSGEKTITYRLGEKYADNLEVGLTVSAIDSSSDESFGKLEILNVKKLTLEDVPLDLAGHEKYQSVSDLVASMQKHYPHKNVTPQSIVSFLKFKLL